MQVGIGNLEFLTRAASVLECFGSTLGNGACRTHSLRSVPQDFWLYLDAADLLWCVAAVAQLTAFFDFMIVVLRGYLRTAPFRIRPLKQGAIRTSVTGSLVASPLRSISDLSNPGEAVSLNLSFVTIPRDFQTTMPR